MPLKERQLWALNVAGFWGSDGKKSVIACQGDAQDRNIGTEVVDVRSKQLAINKWIYRWLSLWYQVRFGRIFEKEGSKLQEQ